MPVEDRGFTLIEVLIAMLLASVVALGLAPLFALAMAVVHAARDETVETTLAIQKLEQLIAPWASADLTMSPPDALSADTSGYSERVDSTGQPLGAGPGWGGAYIRRWSVSPPPSGASAPVLRVLVTTPRRDAINARGVARDGHAGEVVLTSMRVAGNH